jgi:hypothetical protein
MPPPMTAILRGAAAKVSNGMNGGLLERHISGTQALCAWIKSVGKAV